MSDAPFREPKLAINRVYTKHGDRGTTKLVGGQEVKKSDLRIEAYGTVDELNAFVGHARVSIADTKKNDRLARLDEALLRVQHELFNLGSILATLPGDVGPKQPRVTEIEIEALEHDMDSWEKELAPLRSFVLPGGARLAVDLHVARTVCRRAERRLVELAEREPGGVDLACVRYLNRLSDAFFVWSRAASLALGAAEVLWEPNRSASAERKEG